MEEVSILSSAKSMLTFSRGANISFPPATEIRPSMPFSSILLSATGTCNCVISSSKRLYTNRVLLTVSQTEEALCEFRNADKKYTPVLSESGTCINPSAQFPVLFFLTPAIRFELCECNCTCTTLLFWLHPLRISTLNQTVSPEMQ